MVTTQQRTVMKLPVLLAACLLAASTLSFAQAPQGDAAKAPRKARFDCSQAKDPKACEENRAKLKAAHDKATKACESKKGGERHDCMRREMCAQSIDPAKCEAGVKERTARRQAAREACKDKKGDDLKACMREQRGAKK
jgi:Spy/CpxP family protein refolding chaperone